MAFGKTHQNFKKKKGQSRGAATVNKHIKQGKSIKEEIGQISEGLEELESINPDDCNSFDAFPLSLATKNGLEEAGFTVPTRVQRQTLVHSLRGMDVVAAAKTGSGKTLAFIIPMLELLYSKKWNYMDGVGALIITPTRELAYQIFEVLNTVGKRHHFSAGLVIGGKDLKFEWKRVSVCNIMICTPGRLLQHMTENPDFECMNSQILILDEADLCLSMGFANQMNMILEQLPEERQTLLFSATQTRDVKDLIRAGCQNPIFVSSHEYSKTATPKMLSSSYYVCNDHDKITFLWSFLGKHKHTKSIIFLSTCKQVKYMSNIFQKLNPGIPILAIHGALHQLKRMAIYDRFCQEKCVALFATDVAARGLDIPSVSWVVQLDCPEDVTAYIHRAGRTARHTQEGESLLLLTTFQETEMIKALKARNIPIEKINVDGSYLSSPHIRIEGLLTRFQNLKEDAVRSFKSYFKNVYMMKNKRIFDVKSIDADAYARSLGLAVTPRIRFIERRQKKASTKEKLEVNEDTGTSKPRTTLDFEINTSDKDEDNFLTSTKGRIDIEEKLNTLISRTENASAELENKKLGKVITKYAAVKRLKKKGEITNTRVTFNDEGNPDTGDLDSSNKRGINITELKEILKAEDQVDKKADLERKRTKKFKEKEKAKRKRKNQESESDEESADGGEESDSSITQNLLDELPDPDKIYGEKESDTEEDVSHGELDDSNLKSSGSDSEVEIESKRKQSGKIKMKEVPTVDSDIKRRKKFKKRKFDEAATSESISNLDVSDKEQLALMLLQRK